MEKHSTSDIQHQTSNWKQSGIGRWMLVIGCWMFVSLACAKAESIIKSVHNLSVNGPGTIKATTETDACIFCHTAHHSNGATPLWNHNLSAVTKYVVYSSARLDSLNLTIPQPNGSSRLCLSCHDGTVALGSVSSSAAKIQMQGGVTTMPSGDTANLGTDLSADHPISFVYDAKLAASDPEIRDPNNLKQPNYTRMDKLGRLQCTSCHDPHNDQYGNFLVMDNTGSALCLSCHQPSSWSGSVHALSTVVAPAAITAKVAAQTGGTTAKPMTMAAIGCENCHMSHKAGSRQSLLQSDTPEQNCFICHNGTTARKDLVADFQKPSIHPITLNSQSHSPVEDPINPPERHVTCADCHNPHAATTTTAVAPNASGALAGVTGVTAAGGIITPVLKEYEVCFRCHADSIERGPALVSRQFPQTNTRLQFSTANQSFHPVEAIGKNQTSVPSLISPTWTVNSVIYCTDCHNSDTGPGAGGNGANGPHGSIYRPILERNLNLADYQPESAAAYALCYKCHSRSVVLSNASFRFHNLHVVQQQTACTTCHDSHGVANAPHLVNFNTTYVTNSVSGMVRYISTGTQHGICTLSCHGVEHKNTAY